MSDVIAATLIGAGATLAGVVVSAVIGETRLWLSERRQRNERARRRQLEAIEQTRVMLTEQVMSIQHTSVGDIEAAKAATKKADDQRRASLWLIGNAEVIRAWQDLLAASQRRFGQTISAEDAVHTFQVLGRVNEALDAQEERVLKGRPTSEVTPAERRELGDVATFAAKMLPIDRYPSIPARLARLIVVALNRLKGR